MRFMRPLSDVTNSVYLTDTRHRAMPNLTNCNWDLCVLGAHFEYPRSRFVAQTTINIDVRMSVAFEMGSVTTAMSLASINYNCSKFDAELFNSWGFGTLL